jgi:hypothetical protein
MSNRGIFSWPPRRAAMPPIETVIPLPVGNPIIGDTKAPTFMAWVISRERLQLGLHDCQRDCRQSRDCVVAPLLAMTESAFLCHCERSEAISYAKCQVWQQVRRQASKLKTLIELQTPASAGVTLLNLRVGWSLPHRFF